MNSRLSDFDSLSDSSSSEDQEDMDSIYNGRARSIFSNLEETIEKIDDFLLFERGFSNGDIVCLVSDSLGQMGKVVNADMTVDLENINGHKTRNISSKQLQKLRSISIGDYVVHGAWLGKVEKIVDRLTVLFDDGTECELTEEGPEKIVSLSEDLIEDPPFKFYPGQRVLIESSVSKTTHWLCGVRKDYKQEQATVCKVEAGIVHVDWLISATANGERGPTPPPSFQEFQNLTVLSCYPYSNWQLGDWVVIPAEDKSGAHHGTRYQEIGVIVKTKTKVDVIWQDGSQSLGLDSNVVYPVNIIDAHDFWPDSFVMEKGSVDCDEKRVSRWGVVRDVDPTERTVKVKWCKNSFLDCEGEEIVSAYELVEHPDYSYCLGEIVFRTDEIVVGPTEDGGEAEFLSCFGTVVGLKNGGVEVKWGTGATSKVAPYEIYRVDKCEGTSDENAQPPNEEVPLKNQFPGQDLKEISGLNSNNAKESSISEVAIGIFTSITSNILGSLSTSLIGRYKFTSEIPKIHSKSPDEEEEEEEAALELSNFNLGGEFEDLEIKVANEDITFPSSSKLPGSSFSRFDMVNDCSDHHFVNESGMDTQSPQVRRAWLKKVQQEWSILEKDLPGTIYIRAYEERMDLLRAAIVGSDGTPYHDGLFFFDIYLPPQYPNEPPMVHYNSGGLRINPNLYESGKICLSLLNTWTGSQDEVWNPKSSTILQLLLSLQALVLNEKPYFNEAGYDSQIGKAEGEKNSFSYNENAFLVSCRSMLYLLRNPPRNFEALVKEHFERRGRHILLACRAYMQGASIGYPFECGKDEEDILQGRSSTGFKIMLTKLYSRLVEAFSDKGIDCREFLDQVPQ
ncbi:hypothetical protein ABFS82_08G142000 [Erythranthe guttata]|uniref:E2 ubiquitin-conjugating enzyme n=1 Tax=Erythranthe guttata TaxID=4155 RepID=A0A022RTQ6_ERYGU|nr:PREDICTED: probable ubiquitin-conjugating enzyme E2 24 [Erythranthe guttata]XP_012830372.1 PREDICTED: probable ubiquitin-conjugating enzyme E2 24 [Erythranthe guttata]EYU43391.1 hypothetical protein MIMGU_mgv1a001292mg [Erythranthe guttata]|eukprot:XP_012830371.1 PREDICTED: probable ubiquitin-conjugating enzyme E2 24 [Erythranthe guttata]